MKTLCYVLRMLMSVLTVAAVAGCTKPDDGLEDRAKKQAEQEGKVTTDLLEKKARMMEQDLAARHRFYQAVAGTYEGTFKTDQGTFAFRITLIPSLAPFPVDRIRQLEEIAADLNGLHFNIQVLQWNPLNELGAVGCRVEEAKPNLYMGTISIVTEACPNLYMLGLTDLEHPTWDAETSEAISAKILGGEMQAADALAGEIRLTNSPKVYKVFAKRVE